MVSRLIWAMTLHSAIIAGLALGPMHSASASTTQSLWFTAPAKDCMTEALPIGNARIGAMVFGDPLHERLVLNDDSLWTGGENPSGDYGTMGEFQTLGNLTIDLDTPGAVSDYRRDLVISDAIAHVRYSIGGVQFERELLASHPRNVIAVRLKSSAKGAYTGTIRLADGHGATTIATCGSQLVVNGTLSNGLKYTTHVRVSTRGGNVIADGGALRFVGCDEVTLYIAAGTDYSFDYAKGYRGEAPEPKAIAAIDDAVKAGYDRIKAQHVKDYQSLFNRVRFDLGSSAASVKDLPTPVRKAKAATEFDPEMESLLFQYGRYLLISSSRPGGLPANLQGLWNDTNRPAWNSDYHSNINIQMNYWPAEVTNLGECQLPFFDLIKSQLEPWRKATSASGDFTTNKGEPAKRGFAIRTSHNTMGGMGWKWDRTANAWYCTHLWEHYAFTHDKKFLKEVALPILKETCEFWQDQLKTLPNGQLVVPNAWSPEHGPEEDGVSYSQEIVWELFHDYTLACAELGVDDGFATQVATMRDQLARPGIGSWGQLLEWMHEKKNDPEGLDSPNDHHRHTSHLFGLYPGTSISPDETPKLAEAARVSLTARSNTGDVREWSFAWRTALWARLFDGETAHSQIQELLKDRNTCANLFGLHPPMQIDGNFGVTAAIAEMLVQSQDKAIRLLPALPKAWSKGSVSGLRARGGFVVDVDWADGRLVHAHVHGTPGARVEVRYAKKSVWTTLDGKGKAEVGAELG